MQKTTAQELTGSRPSTLGPHIAGAARAHWRCTASRASRQGFPDHIGNDGAQNKYAQTVIGPETVEAIGGVLRIQRRHLPCQMQRHGRQPPQVDQAGAGQQTREVLTELGLDAAAIDDLIAAGIVQEAG